MRAHTFGIAASFLIGMLISAALALAQLSPSPQVTDTALNGRTLMLQQQRDEASNRMALLAGQVAELQEKLAKTEKAATDCGKQGQAEKK